MSLKRLMHHITHRKIRGADHFWRISATACEVNEIFKRVVISVDNEKYTLPFTANPRRSAVESDFWQSTDDINTYEYTDERSRKEADARFESLWPLIGERLKRDAKILDVGCNTGFFLEKLRERGFTNLHGIDPQQSAIAWAHEHRPHLGIVEGFFGPPESDIECDVLIMFKSIFRIPYQAKLFDAIDRCTKTYAVFEGVPEMTNFPRDLHLGLAKKGFMCLDKRVTDLYGVPIGHPGADNQLVYETPPAPGEARPNPPFFSNYVFRRIRPRA